MAGEKAAQVRGSKGLVLLLLEPLMGAWAVLPIAAAGVQHDLPDHPAQEHERLRLQAQQLQAQLAKKEEEGREGNLRVAQLQAALEERTQALEAAQVCWWCWWCWLVASSCSW